MTRRVVVADGQLYTFSPDDDVPLADRTWAIVSARLVDEITDEPSRGDVTVEAAEAGFISRVASDGLVGLIGIPARVFPKLAMQSYTINLTVTAQGYVARQVPVTIGPQVNFPNAFTPIIGSLLLHRLPVIIRGRTVLTNGITTTPLAGVTVSVTGIWRTFPPAHLAVPSDPPNLVFLQPPLYFPRRAATGQLRRRDVVQVMGQDKHLLTWVSSGSAFLNLSDRVSIAVGDILIIDLLNPDIMEYLTIGSIAGASTADQPARITLTYPLAYAHRSNAVVRKVTLQAPAVNNQFSQDAIAGDCCVFLASMNNLNLAQTVEITDGINPAEYHNLGRFSVTSDATGYFQLPPLSRVAQLEIRANDGGVHPTITQVVSPDYSLREKHIDFTFK
jgi:hypothetical protein